MSDYLIHRARAAAAAVVLALAMFVSLAGAAQAGRPAACKPHAEDDGVSPFVLAARVLTDPSGGDLTLRITTAAAGCVVPDQLDSIRVKTHGPPGSRARVQRFGSVAAPGGVATVDIGQVARGQRVGVKISFRSAGRHQGYELRGSTSALLRPDLAVTVSAPRQILNGRAFTVDVQVAEQNGDAGATATLTLAAGAKQVGTAALDIAPGGTVTKSFEVTSAAPGALQLAAEVGGAAPREANLANNDAGATVEVTEFELDQSQVLVPSLAGYGAHFNHRVYAKISRDVGVTMENVLDMESKMVALQPQFVRIFVNNNDLIDADRKASFVKTVLLAQRAGATINITWQGGTLDVKT